MGASGRVHGSLLVAIIVPTAVWFLDRRRAGLSEKMRLQAIAAITRLALEALRRLHTEMDEADSNIVSVESFHEVQIATDAADSIRVDAPGSPPLVTNVAIVKRWIRRMSGLIPEFLPPTGTLSIVPINFAELYVTSKSRKRRSTRKSRYEHSRVRWRRSPVPPQNDGTDELVPCCRPHPLRI
ncbi:hypothetical protein LMG27177_07477 [Paraburkholderia fynbosensis]|uniref:Uncharacterized protein n=1 Tax=Paraburkholderia fynbosensis TaxID=1200993 RepID=A0A6J5H387_9BURK|nr:hypothetical protein LMG27177_07477 [Paraburkholderia fynbosensis]